MKRKLISLLIAVLILGGMANAAWKYNPFTGELDYTIYSGTATTGDIIYYNGTIWTVLGVGANGEILTVAAGLPSWGASALVPASTAQYAVLVGDATGGWVEDTAFTVNTGSAYLEDDNLVVFGDDNDASMNLDTGSHIFILGIPTTASYASSKGMVICDNDDIGFNFGGTIFTTANPRVNFMDSDLDSWFYIGYGTDDMPNLESIHHELHFNYTADQDVSVFTTASSDETPEFKIFGFRAADALRSLQIGVGVDAADTASFDGLTNYLFDGTVQPDALSTPGTVDVNDAGATGEIGVDFNSISSTFSTIAQSDAEGIANKSDLRIGLDDDDMSLLIIPRSLMGTDFGLTASVTPVMYLYNAAGDTYSRFSYNGYRVFQTSLISGSLEYGANQLSFINYRGTGGFRFFQYGVDISSGNLFKFVSDAAIELTDDNAEQAWMYVEPKVLQTSTAAFDGFYLNVDTANLSFGDGTTGDGNNMFRLALGGTTKFKTDMYGYTQAGTTPSALADNATYSSTIADSWTGIVIVQNVTDTTSGIYHLDGTAIAVINQNAAFTTTQGTDNKINVYVAGNVLTVENTHAAAKTVKVMFIGT